MNKEYSTPIYTVSEINREVRSFLEENLSSFWVTGEISNFVCPSSGHWYFTLKDSKASLRCAFFKPKARGIQLVPENGLQVQLHGNISLYEPRGEYQFIADKIELAGEGLLQKAFEQLKEKLFQEGLFSEEHKKPLPAFIQTIGVVTSSTGAAFHDILQVLKHRFPLIKVILYPTLVQGVDAANDIVNAIHIANSRNECDVLIVGRGGGSLEDLWPFNEEIVARKIFESVIPIVSAVGHEIDFTIADFVADVRAPTPSSAAALISPDQQILLQQIVALQNRLYRNHPRHQMLENQQQLDVLEQLLFKTMTRMLIDKQYALAELSRALHTLSPLATLDRGYALLYKQGIAKRVVSSIQHVKTGEGLIVHLKDGKLECVVTK
jgi:exodeoxyribonuclease VII large subunit